MMAALMSACSMIQTGASTEEVSTHTICALDFFLFFSLPERFFLEIEYYLIIYSMSGLACVYAFSTLLWQLESENYTECL